MYWYIIDFCKILKIADAWLKNTLQKRQEYYLRLQRWRLYCQDWSFYVDKLQKSYFWQIFKDNKESLNWILNMCALSLTICFKTTGVAIILDRLVLLDETTAEWQQKDIDQIIQKSQNSIEYKCCIEYSLFCRKVNFITLIYKNSHRLF